MKATCAACDRAFPLDRPQDATVLVSLGDTTQLVFLCPSCLVRGADVGTEACADPGESR